MNNVSFISEERKKNRIRKIAEKEFAISDQTQTKKSPIHREREREVSEKSDQRERERDCVCVCGKWVFVVSDSEQ